MKLYIAEKPSLGKAIATVIGIKKRGDGFLECVDGTIVTWCFGHLYEQVAPEVYDKNYKKWSFEYLPIIPDKWIIKPKKDKGVKKQLSIIKKLVASCTSIVNAGDPDREGQLLIDEVLEDFNNKKKVERIWLASLDEKSVKKAIENLKSNEEYRTLKESAEARSRADWLAGMNYTRAVTLVAQQSGVEGVLSIGRVQTPTLALIVNRDTEIKSFKSVPYFIPTIKLSHKSGDYKAAIVIDDNIQVDEFSRIISKSVAQTVIDQVNFKKGVVFESKDLTKKQSAPMPYSLSALQKEASAQFGFSASEVLSLAQTLYEAKITTYPRSDCGFLPEEQLSDVPSILEKLKINGFNIINQCDLTLKSKAWNTSKVTAHHGIIPTGQSGSSLMGKENQLYTMICNRFIEQFFPDYKYISQKIITDIGGYKWKSEGKRNLDIGWKAVEGKEVKENPLPSVAKTEPVSCTSGFIDSKETTPPARFTDGTIIEAMASVHRFVSDPKIKARLKENSGIGTEATRANILEVLISRKYISRKKKQLHATEKGIELITLIPDSLKDPGLTALWEDFLKKIENGTLSSEEFINQQKQIIPKILNKIKMISFSVDKDAHLCPKCNSVLKQWASKKDKKFKYWTCMGDKSHPAYFDKKGKPDGEMKSK